jgi:hypothetical protein
MLYTGGCHCGAVRYQVEMTIDKLLSCNCSICSKRGHLLAFAPASQFQLLKGEDALTDYQFAKKIIHHCFCKHCGVASFGEGSTPDGTPMRSINVRCLDEVDIKQFPIIDYDGKSI